MFYHAINGEGTGPQPEPMAPVLLWTNPNPTSAFAAQTIELDLSEYAGVIIEGNSYINNIDYGFREFIKIGESKSGGRMNPTKDAGASRLFTINNNGIDIGNCFEYQTAKNEAAIPTKIYGVKEYVVEPVIGEILWTNSNPSTAFEAQKISMDLSNAKGVLIEFIVSGNYQEICSRELVYKGETSFSTGYTAGVNATSRKITAVENDGVTFGAGWAISSESAGVLLPYKIYSIN